MEKEELRKSFHALFNKINNIFTAAGSNKMFLEDGNLDKVPLPELKIRIQDASEALAMIEKNATLLNNSLQEIYKTLLKEIDSGSCDTQSCNSQK